MKTVGILCNCSATTDPKQKLSPSLVNRALLIDELLAPDLRVFLYSPRDVGESGEVNGYRVEGHEFVPVHQPVPKVNANWTYGTRKLLDRGMGYKRFKQWTRKNEIGVYVPFEFSELVSNKRKAYEALRAHDPALHPHTEDFRGASVQIESFLERSPIVFIKPRAGNRGNAIFVLRRQDGQVSMKYYDTGDQRLFAPITLDAALGVIEVAAGQQRYVIQEGVESLRFEGAVFDVRVVMVHDGEAWHEILETRLAPRGSDLSNVFQGGSICVTENLLREIFGEDAGKAREDEIRRISHGVAEHLESLYPAQLMELGLDLVLDESGEVHLVEVNAKPGVAGFGSETKVFDWKPEDAAAYERWVRPHVRHLASFLRTRFEAIEPAT